MCGKYDGLEGHSHPRLTSRRSILKFGAVGLGAALLGGCVGGGDDDDPTPAATATTGGNATAAATTAATTAATAAATAATGTGGSAAAKALTAVQAFIAGLSAEQKTTAMADRTQANLSQWSNLPDQAFKRAGVRMDSLTADQQKAALAILETILSTEGYAQVNEITTADGVLATTSTGSNPGFGADRYYVRFVGAPSATTPWTIQYGGHHLALNVTIVGSKMTMAPTLWGSQPALYSLNGKNFEPLGGETNKAFALLTALDGTQQSAAVLSGSKSDLVLGAGQDGKTVAAAGVNSSTFTSAQKQALLNLVQEWLRPLNADSVAARMATAESELDKMTFAWSGSTAAGSAIYYRVQSATAVMEFSHQGQGSDGVNHIHSIYREIGNDYGVGLAA